MGWRASDFLNGLRLTAFCGPNRCQPTESRTKPIAWGQRIGVSTVAVVTWQLEHRPHPEQGYRACLGLLALVRRYSAERLEAACTRAMVIRAPNLRSVTNILKCGLDRQPSLFPAAENPATLHENVRDATDPQPCSRPAWTAAPGALDRRLCTPPG